MKKYIPILIFLLTVNFLHPVLAQSNEDFNTVEMEQIKREVEIILNAYQKYGTLTETFTYLSKDYTENFRQLFASNAIVLNDIGSPENQNEYLTIDEYMSVIQKWYPEGLSLIFEDLKDGKDINMGIPYKYQDRFAVRVNTEKTISALTKEYDKVNRVDTITFIITFDDELSAFKIAEINTEQPLNPKENQEQTTQQEVEEAIAQPVIPQEEEESIAQSVPQEEEESITQSTPQKKEESVARKTSKRKKRPVKGIKLKKKKPRLYRQVNKAEKGFFANLLGSTYPLTSSLQLNDKWINDLNMEGVDVTSPIAFSPRVELDYFLTERWGIGVGLELNSYKSNIFVDTLHYSKPDSRADVDTIKYFGSDIEEKSIYSTTDISVMLKYKQPFSNNLFLYGGIGIKAVFANFRKPPVRVSNLNYYSVVVFSGSYNEDMHGYLPNNQEEAEVLRKNNLFSSDELKEAKKEGREDDANQYELKTETEAFIFEKTNYMFTANLGFAYSINKRLKIKMGVLATAALNRNIFVDELVNPAPQLGLVEVSRNNSDETKVRNNYLSIAGRQGNQWNFRTAGIEIGLMYKLGSIDFF